MNAFITNNGYEEYSEEELYDCIVRKKAVLCTNMKLHVFTKDRVWKEVSDDKAILFIRELFSGDERGLYMTDAFLRKVIKDFKTNHKLQKTEQNFKHPELIKFNNGIWNIYRQELFSDDTVLFKRKVDVTITNTGMIEESQCFINFCCKVFSLDCWEKKKEVLYEIIGYCISDIPNVKKALFLIGPTNCGKSVILRFIQRLVGEDDVSNITLSHFAGKFNIAEMYRKTLNISGEVPSQALSGRVMDIFKNITGGDRITLETKGVQPFSATVDTKLLFAGNVLPTFHKIDGTDAIIERLHILLFDNSVEENERDTQLEDKLWHDRNKIIA